MGPPGKNSRGGLGGSLPPREHCASRSARPRPVSCATCPPTSPCRRSPASSTCR
jgi:hypothetical protein